GRPRPRSARRQPAAAVAGRPHRSPRPRTVAIPFDEPGSDRIKEIVGEHLFIVSRQQLDLYRYLSRALSSEVDVQVILHRRYLERRINGERRLAPRGGRRRTA